MTEKILLGIDEVGRGPWAGPLVVGAVILGPDFQTLPEYGQLTDSKKLSAGKRELLNDVILEHAAATGLGWVPTAEIDQYGLGPALKLAARRAVKQILAQLTEAKSTPNHPATKVQKFDEIIIDGTINLLAGTPLEAKVALLPKADFLVKEVSAASIIAKVARDRYMAELAEKYPSYGFESHVGYGTAAHKSALLELGPCPEHRKSFRPIADLLQTVTNHETTATNPRLSTNAHSSNSAPTTTVRGQKAEQIVAEYLKTEQHHTIIAHNFKTKSYEIDLISADSKNIYFTEVKYRKAATYGAPLAAITPKKHQQIRFAAESFLATHPEYRTLQPLLTVAAVSGPDFHLDDWFVLPE